MLIREVAYGGLAKSARADLHHGFAVWLTERAGDELLEIRAFHLDQATRLLEGSTALRRRGWPSRRPKALTRADHRALSREGRSAAR